jgi:Streptomyces sporulation and cell division protein, SsgA
MESIRTVDSELSVRLVPSAAEPIPFSMKLQYATHDPYAVHAAFYPAGPGGTVKWIFSRDVLIEALTRPAGQGDVRMWPTVSLGRDVLYIALSSPGGAALFEAFLPEVESFLLRTLSVVPLGTESERLDMDTELAHLLAES